MKRLLLLLALLFCYGNAEAQNIQTFYLKGFPIGQPKVNLLPRDASKIRVMRRGYSLDASGNPTTALTGVFSDSMTIGVYDGILQDSIPGCANGRAGQTTDALWKSAWIPVYGASMVIWHFTHADTDSVVTWVAAQWDTSSSVTGVLTNVTDWNTTVSGPRGRVTLTAAEDYSTVATVGSGAAWPTKGRKAASLSDGDRTIAMMFPAKDTDHFNSLMIPQRFVQVRIQARCIATGGNATGTANIPYGADNLTGVKVWCEVIYPGPIPFDPIYENYKGASIQ